MKKRYLETLDHNEILSIYSSLCDVHKSVEILKCEKNVIRALFSWAQSYEYEVMVSCNTGYLNFYKRHVLKYNICSRMPKNSKNLCLFFLRVFLALQGA